SRYFITKWMIQMKFGEAVTLMRPLDALWYLANGDPSIRHYVSAVTVVEGKPDLEFWGYGVWKFARNFNLDQHVCMLKDATNAEIVTWNDENDICRILEKSKPVPMVHLKNVAKMLGGSTLEVLLCSLAGAFSRVLSKETIFSTTFALSVVTPATLRVPNDDPSMRNCIVSVRFPLEEAIKCQSLEKRFQLIKAQRKKLRPIPDRFALAMLSHVINILPLSMLDDRLVYKSAAVSFSFIPSYNREIQFLSKQPFRRYMFWIPVGGVIEEPRRFPSKEEPRRFPSKEESCRFPSRKKILVLLIYRKTAVF
ncbi:unnamed protein product, partial [Cyprideis torosa]